MRKLIALCSILAATAPTLGAQTVDQDLIRGQDAYEKSNVELAKQIFSGIIASRQQVTAEQKVIAYKYLGAYWALQSTPGARDSAANFFIAALDYDPFTDLDRDKFAADEQAAFNRAKTLLFRVGIRPIEPRALDPTSSKADSSTYKFQLVTTHSASLTIEIVNLADPNKREQFPNIGNSDGLREIEWNGLINTQRADTGIYEFRVTATSRLQQKTVVEFQRFRIEHFHAPLEDSIPPFKDVNLGGTDTLKSRYSAARPYTDGAKGLFIASLAAGLPFIALPSVTRQNMTGWQSHLSIGAALGLIAGSGAAWYATSHRDDARAAAENTRRRNLRAQFNAGVAARNAARLEKTILIIRPLTAAGIGD